MLEHDRIGAGFAALLGGSQQNRGVILRRGETLEHLLVGDLRQAHHATRLRGWLDERSNVAAASAERNDVLPLVSADRHHAESVRSLKQMEMTELFRMHA